MPRCSLGMGILKQILWHFLIALFCCCAVEEKVDLGLWIDETQVKEFSGLAMQIWAIKEGKILAYILDPNFEIYLPVIPPEVDTFNFTWSSGESKTYRYNFTQLTSYKERTMDHPRLSIKRMGVIPKEPQVFQVFLRCKPDQSGLVNFSITLVVKDEKKEYLNGTPLKIKLHKQCALKDSIPLSQCDKKCANGGKCNSDNICECPKGYMGHDCKRALCYPQCMNNGTCIQPGVCSCVDGFQGPHCEGGICVQKCQNGGKCIQKDLCSCRRGYYGPLCEYSKCNIPCINGRCIGVNRCKCKKGFVGTQCDREKKSKKRRHERKNKNKNKNRKNKDKNNRKLKEGTRKPKNVYV